MPSTTGGGIAWTTGRYGRGGLRVAWTGFEVIRPHSTARRRIPCSRLMVLRIDSLPIPSSSSPTRKRAIASGSRSRSLTGPERVPVPQLRIGDEGGALEVRAGVDAPPLLDERRQ